MQILRPVTAVKVAIMSETNYPPDVQNGSPGLRGLKLFLIITAAVASGLLLALLGARLFLLSREFTPVSLNATERQRLEVKLSRLERSGANVAGAPGKQPAPEPYSEEGASREVVFSQRELNGLLAREPELARRLAFNLSADLISARLLIPLDPEIPLVGGKTLKVNAGLEIAMNNRHPVVKLKGVSLWGLPLPNAWLGNLKNVNLITEFGDDGGFWSVFSGGIDEIRVEDGRLRLRLKE